MVCTAGVRDAARVLMYKTRLSVTRSSGWEHGSRCSFTRQDELDAGLGSFSDPYSSH